MALTTWMVPEADAALSTLLLVLVAIAAAHASGAPAVAVYALSFWHYLLYWWAYRHGLVTARRLRREAVGLKSLALVAFGYAWATQPSTWPAVLAMAAGFGVNGIAAWRLGPERTYYGWELGDVSHERVTSFPYSVLPHPMLVGNMVAFAGPLAAPPFREAWWPLSLLHVAMNVGLLLMETCVSPWSGSAEGRPATAVVRRGGVAWTAGATVAGAVLGTIVSHVTAPADAARRRWPTALGAVVGLQFCVLARTYVTWLAGGPAGRGAAARTVRHEVSP